jgi:hypothetical protein
MTVTEAVGSARQRVARSSGTEQPSAQPQGRLSMISNIARTARIASVALLLASLAAPAPAEAGGTLRIAMTASDVPTTTGAPDNGFEGLRFLGYPVYEGLVLWDLTRARQAGRDQAGARRELGAGQD